MKKLAVNLLITLTFIVSIFGSAEAAKKSVAVMPMENVSGYNAENVAEIMTEELIVTIINSGKYTVLERTQIDTIMQEQGFQNIAGNPDSAVEVGNFSGANYSVIGKVTMATTVKNTSKDLLAGSGLEGFVNGVKGKVAINIRFVNNETGELIFAKDFESSKSGGNVVAALHNACKDIAEKFLGELSDDFSGRIVGLDSKKIYIDQGRGNGLRKGDKLLVVRETDPIIVGDKIVGMQTVDIGRIKVIEVNEEYSVCEIDKVFKGQAIQKGDVVKRG